VHLGAPTNTAGTSRADTQHQDVEARSAEEAAAEGGETAAETPADSGAPAQQISTPATTTPADTAPANTAPASTAAANTASRGPSLGDQALGLAADVVPKMIASGLHLGLTRTAMTEVTQALTEGSTVQMLGGAAATALVTGAVHFGAEMVIKPVLTNAVGKLIKPRKPEDVFPEGAGNGTGETQAEKRARMAGQQALGKVDSALGQAVGLTGFGVAQGARTALGKTGHNANMVSSGIGGGLMQVGHSLTNLVTTVDGEHTHEVVTSHDPLGKRLYDGLAEVRPKKVPDGDGGQRDETAAEVGKRVAHNILVGRALPMLQGGFAQYGVNAAFTALGIGPNFGTGMASSVALLGAGVFPGLSTMPSRLAKTGGWFDGVKSAVKAPPQQLAALVSKDHRVAKATLTAIDMAHGATKQLLVLPAQAVADSVAGVSRVPGIVVGAVRDQLSSRGAHDAAPQGIQMT
jgi:hypothetical protein